MRVELLVEDIRSLFHEAEGRTTYHVTYHKHLPSIAQHGLRAGSGQTMGHGAGLQKHSSKKTFTTSPEGVSFWHGRAEDHANDRSDDPHKTGHTPVVLRAHLPKGAKLTKDKPGSEDASAPAYHTKAHIPPEHVHVFHGGKWHPISDHEKLSAKDAYHVEKDEDGKEVHYSRPDHENPFHPKHEHLKESNGDDHEAVKGWIKHHVNNKGHVYHAATDTRLVAKGHGGTPETNHPSHYVVSHRGKDYHYDSYGLDQAAGHAAKLSVRSSTKGTK